MTTKKNDVKKLFRKLGSCSRTFFYILNRDFGHLKENEEHAADPLAGGIYQQGYQCGMLWGSSLAAGAEAFRRFDDRDQAIGMTIKSTQHILQSFLTQAKSADCEDITECDWSSKLSMAKYFFSGKFLSCFNMAEKWAPDAIQAARAGLVPDNSDFPKIPMSCASEVVKKMGATDEEMVMVAGFAGGYGLSGNACGALAAAVWMKTLLRIRKQEEKITYKDPYADQNMEAFYAATNYEILCNNITGQCFKNIEEHTEFLKNGGCKNLIQILSQL